MKLSLKNKNILICGASGGLGTACSLGFAKEKANLFLAGRNKKRIESISNKISQFYKNSNVKTLIVDTKNDVESQKLYDFFISSNLKLDCLVCLIGNGKGSTEAIPSAKKMKTSWSINFNSAVNVIRNLEKILIKSKGTIIIVSSIAGINYLGAPTAYSVSKLALIGLGKNLAHKLSPNVRVNIVAPGNLLFPGSTWESKIKREPLKVKQMLKDKVPLNRFGYPEEVANAVIFLSSERSSFITGATLVVDGGQTLSLSGM